MFAFLWNPMKTNQEQAKNRTNFSPDFNLIFARMRKERDIFTSI